MLTIANVTKSYGPRTLFADVSLNIARTDRLGLIGANGADFGGPGHVRLNFGCPRERLREILRRMKAVVARAPGRRA